MDGELYKLRQRLTDIALLTFALLSIVSMVLVYFRSIDYGLTISFYIQLVTCITVLFFTFFRKRIPLQPKLFFIALFLLTVMITGNIDFGFLASGKIYIVVITVFVSFVLTYSQSIGVLITFLFVYGLLGYLYSSGTWEYTVDANEYIKRPLVWIMDGFILFLSAFGLLYIGHNFFKLTEKNYQVIKKKSEEIRKSEEKYKALYETSLYSIILLKNAEFFDCNERTLYLFNCTKEEFRSRKFDDYIIFSEGQKNVEYSDIIRKAADAKGQVVEWKLRKFTGEEMDVRIRMNSIHLDDDNYIQFVLRDVTGEKKNVKELEDYRQQLEELVRDRTYELEAANEELRAINEEVYNTNEELESQKKELQSTLKKLNMAQEQLIESEKMASIGILMAGVAHEINNPLNFILGGIYSLRTLLEQLEEEDNQGAIMTQEKTVIDNMEVGVERINKIIESLNHFNRANNDFIESCDLHLIINNCLSILHNELKHKVILQKEFIDKNIFVIGNDGKLHQVFLNIINNAVQSIRNKGEITIATKVVKEGRFAEIIIQDTGEGISEENLKRIFDPFFTTKGVGKGTGLGLSIVYKIVNDHNGSIDVKSKEGDGTTFTIILPASIEGQYS